jgi:hypothetical protein
MEGFAGNHRPDSTSGFSCRFWNQPSRRREFRRRLTEAQQAPARFGLDRPPIETRSPSFGPIIGLHVEDAKGEHCFQSTLLQPLFYCRFSAWI